MLAEADIVLEPLETDVALLLLILAVHQLHVSGGAGLGGELPLTNKASPAATVAVESQKVTQPAS